jgi:hypothetical protein
MWAPSFLVQISAAREPLVQAARSFLNLLHCPQRAKLSPRFFGEYFGNDLFRILLKPLGETLFRPNCTLTMLISGSESFYRQDEGRHFDTTFYLVSIVVVR